jgi:predicted 3-demethylubiquinone-9 3-methyltransferase (glyoxalase superfamily)
MNNIYPCHWFDGKANEAATFYCNIFPNSHITTNTPMVVLYELNGNKFMGLNGGPKFQLNHSSSNFVHCSTLNETTRIWNALLEDGKVMMELNAYPWSEQYGWVQDKFGCSWQIMKSDTDKIIPAFLFTGNQFGNAKTAIDFYTKVFSNSSIINLNYFDENTPFAGKVTYGEFTLNDNFLIVQDGPGNHNVQFTEATSLVLNCKTQEEIDYFWNSFTTNEGQESRCGWCKDQFGISWQIIPEQMASLMSDASKAARVMEEVLKMKKIDLATLINA